MSTTHDMTGVSIAKQFVQKTEPVDGCTVLEYMNNAEIILIKTHATVKNCTCSTNTLEKGNPICKRYIIIRYCLSYVFGYSFEFLNSMEWESNEFIKYIHRYNTTKFGVCYVRSDLTTEQIVAQNKKRLPMQTHLLTIFSVSIH